MKYLQDKHAPLIVQGSFDPTVSRYFRFLQRNSSFTPEALGNLRSAATIASAYRLQQGRADGRGDGDGGRRGLFSQQATRGFPATRRFGRRVRSTEQ